MKKSANTLTNDVAIVVHYSSSYMPTQKIRAEMLKMPEVMSKLNCTEKSIFIATTEKTIGQYSEKEFIALAAKAFYWIAIDIGVRDTSSADWNAKLVRICNLLRQYYPKMTLSDINIAFELMVTGGLNDYLPRNKQGQPDKEHYQMFNADYVFRVLNAYKVKRNEVLVKAKNAVPKPEIECNLETKEFYIRQSKLDAIWTFAFYKYHNRMPKITLIAEKILYEVLSNVGLVAPIEVAQKEQEFILKKTLNSFLAKQMTGDYKILKEKGLSAEEIQFEAFVLCRRKAIREAFNDIIRDDINIQEFIK